MLPGNIQKHVANARAHILRICRGNLRLAPLDRGRGGWSGWVAMVAMVLGLGLTGVCFLSFSGTMPVLTNAKHEAFAQAVAVGGKSATAAYRKVYGAKGPTCEQRGSKLMVKVKSRLEELRANANRIAAEKLNLTQEEVLQYLARVVRTPVGEVDETSDLCQEWTRDELAVGGQQGKLKQGNLPEGNEKSSASALILKTKVKMPNKLDAIKRVAAMCGWNAPQKVEGSLTVGVSPVVEEAVSKLLS